jgi:hypothetical protein
MTIVVIEKIGSRTIERAVLSGTTGKRVFEVYNTVTTGEPLTAMQAVRSAGVPQININGVGDRHPEVKAMRVISYSVASSSNSDFLQTITCNYAVLGDTYTAITTGVRGLFMDAWRNFPDPPPVNLQDISGDINGTPVDIAGKPISLSIFQQTVDIRSPFANEPKFDMIRQLTNTRNAQDWMEFPKGVLLFLGASASVTNGNIWTTTYKFAADPVFHARQVAQRERDGKITLANFGLPYAQAAYVFWVQKFPTLANFDALEIGISA